eukprot:c13186_g1_i1.p1 GENE.c13186_g1_i1~~c13186_g1_i1.p1  ORF type:complete len:316 (-),score=65.85 c13186_g1_i1:403-1350(-)
MGGENMATRETMDVWYELHIGDKPEDVALLEDVPKGIILHKFKEFLLKSEAGQQLLPGVAASSLRVYHHGTTLENRGERQPLNPREPVPIDEEYLVLFAPGPAQPAGPANPVLEEVLSGFKATLEEVQKTMARLNFSVVGTQIRVKEVFPQGLVQEGSISASKLDEVPDNFVANWVLGDVDSNWHPFSNPNLDACSEAVRSKPTMEAKIEAALGEEFRAICCENDQQFTVKTDIVDINGRRVVLKGRVDYLIGHRGRFSNKDVCKTTFSDFFATRNIASKNKLLDCFFRGPFLTFCGTQYCSWRSSAPGKPRSKA